MRHPFASEELHDTPCTGPAQPLCRSLRERRHRIRHGKHAPSAYIMTHKPGYDYPATAAHFATVSSTSTNVNARTTDNFTKSVDAFGHYIEPEDEQIHCVPSHALDRTIKERRAMMCNVPTLSIRNNQGYSYHSWAPQLPRAVPALQPC